MNRIELSAFRWVPPFAQGLVRDLRVRWALEESGRDYGERLIGPDDQKSASYRRLQPFGQVPAIRDNELELFESGAIVLHIAEASERLMPADEQARARVRTWMFAALNTIEPPIMMLNVIDMQPPEVAQGAKQLREQVAQMIGGRLDALSTYLGDKEYLVGDRFTAADLLMTTVLRILRTTDLVSSRSRLNAYMQRGESRPAFKVALAAQLSTFAKNAPPQSKHAG